MAKCGKRIWGFACICCVIAGCLIVAAPAWAVGKRPNVDIEVHDSGDSLIVNYEFGEFVQQAARIDGNRYVSIRLGKESQILNEGSPDLPNVCRSLIVADDARIDLSIVDAQYYEIEVDVAPSKGNLMRTVNPKDVPYVFGEAYKCDAFYPGELATIGKPYILRDHRGITVTVNPFQYNPVTRVLRVYTSMSVKLTESGAGEVNVLVDRPNQLSLAFHKIYEHHFINYADNQTSRYAPINEDGEMIIICHDAWLSEVEPFVSHKNSIGIPTTAVGVSTIGNNASSIQAYIQSQYDAGDLAFVLLVGDHEQVATPAAPEGASDPSYAKVAGADDYPDIIVGRFSAETAGQVATQVERTIEHENLPAAEQDWFYRGLGVASDEGDGRGDEGQADDVHMAEIRGWLMGSSYTLIDELYGYSTTPAQVATSINAGRGIVNYCGHGSTTSWFSSGFSNADVNNLVNDNMLPFIISVACVNGNFDGPTCFAEAWVRATNGSEPTGAVAIYASSIDQSWAPPMEAQDEIGLLLSNPSEPYHLLGGLCLAGACSMIDDYGTDGAEIYDTWHIFGDPTLRVVGTVAPPTGMRVSPATGLVSEGPAGGPFSPDSIDFVLKNFDDVPINFEASESAPWVDMPNTAGTIQPGMEVTVTVSLNAAASSLPDGLHEAEISFVNTTSHDGDTTRTISLKVGVPVPVYVFNLDSSPGWTVQGEWEFGRPQGLGGSNGNPDPTSGATGNNVYGVNLAGDYSTTEGGPYHLTTTPIDCSDLTEVSLRYMRWLNTDFQDFAFATVEVSTDGVNWTSIWSNGESEIADSAWSQSVFDISEMADEQSAVQIRWGYEIGWAAWAYSGWNLDDIEIWGRSGDVVDCHDFDLDASGFVGVGDINLIKANYGTCTSGPCKVFDLDNSDFVGVGDINLVKANFGPCP